MHQNYKSQLILPSDNIKDPSHDISWLTLTKWIILQKAQTVASLMQNVAMLYETTTERLLTSAEQSITREGVAGGCGQQIYAISKHASGAGGGGGLERVAVTLATLRDETTIS